MVVQSMCATKTQDIEATIEQVEQLASAGAGLVRIAVDSVKDADALEVIRVLCDVTLRMIEGELYQLTKTGDINILEEEHFEINEIFA